MSKLEAKQVARKCLFVCMFAVVAVEARRREIGSRFIGTRRRVTPGNGSYKRP